MAVREPRRSLFPQMDSPRPAGLWAVAAVRDVTEDSYPSPPRHGSIVRPGQPGPAGSKSASRSSSWSGPS
ncbi:hypothetical protein VTK73DRAFT_6252 [Phialemonium thermophilum]|uniref:Uncharacterized protein n=1 Tax=Phialemonium thermophilum TaxID=223376 RepID=A0ABR3V0F4_9PEZI